MNEGVSVEVVEAMAEDSLVPTKLFRRPHDETPAPLRSIIVLIITSHL